MASVIALNGDGLYFDGQLDPDSLKPLAVFGMRADYVYLSKHSVRYYLSGPRSILLSELTGGTTSSGRCTGTVSAKYIQLRNLDKIEHQRESFGKYPPARP